MAKDLTGEQFMEAMAPVRELAGQMGREDAARGKAEGTPFSHFNPARAREVLLPMGLELLREARGQGRDGFVSMYLPSRPGWHEEIFGKK